MVVPFPKALTAVSIRVGDYVFKLIFVWFSIMVAIMSLSKGKWIPNIGAILRVFVLGFFTIAVIVYGILYLVPGGPFDQLNFGAVSAAAAAAALAVLFSSDVFPVSPKARLLLSLLATATIALFAEFRNEGKFCFKTRIHSIWSLIRPRLVSRVGLYTLAHFILYSLI